jgi:hydrogenase nickel incorporation protein HypA/HybF
MHETAIAQSILDTITEQSAKYHGAKPLRAVISCGQFNAINDEVMTFAFEAAAEGTICQGMRLEIKHNPLCAVCQACQKQFMFDIYSPACPVCKSEQFHFQPDAPLLLEEVEFEEKEEQSTL